MNLTDCHIQAIRVDNSLSSVGRLIDFVTHPYLDHSYLMQFYRGKFLLHPDCFDEIAGLFLIKGIGWEPSRAVPGEKIYSPKTTFPRDIRMLSIGLHPCDFLVTDHNYIIWLGEPKS